MLKIKSLVVVGKEMFLMFALSNTIFKRGRNACRRVGILSLFSSATLLCSSYNGCCNSAQVVFDNRSVSLFFFETTKLNYQMTYLEKLRDPRWQKKRLTILERDEWTCQECGDTKTTLNVHHRAYTGKDPWDTEDNLLITLCEVCHKEEEERCAAAIIDCIKRLKRCGFGSKSFDALPKIFENIDMEWEKYEPGFDILQHAVINHWKELSDSFWSTLSSKHKDPPPF